MQKTKKQKKKKTQKNKKINLQKNEINYAKGIEKYSIMWYKCKKYTFDKKVKK